MPTSPPGSERGFTLVELMVTITVIALMSAAVLWAVPDPRGKVRDDALRFAARVRAARDQAVVTAQPVSVWATAGGYGFDRRIAGRWSPVADKPLRVERWTEGARATLDAPEGRVRVTYDPTGLPDRAADVRLTMGDARCSSGSMRTGACARMRNEAGFTLLEISRRAGGIQPRGAGVDPAGDRERARCGGARSDAGCQHGRTQHALEGLTDARAPATGQSAGVEANGGQTWRWTRQVTPTGDTKIVRIDVAVQGAGGQVLGRATMVRAGNAGGGAVSAYSTAPLPFAGDVMAAEKEDGFTLVEVLVALLIFAILASAGVALLSFSVRAQSTAGRKFDDLAALNRTLSIMAQIGTGECAGTRDEAGTPMPAFAGESGGDAATMLRLCARRVDQS